MQIALEALEANLGNWAAKTKAIPVLRQALETKKQWVGLTDEERREIFDACETTDRGYVLAMCEAKLKERNG
jgi:hypothetical protein